MCVHNNIAHACVCVCVCALGMHDCKLCVTGVCTGVCVCVVSHIIMAMDISFCSTIVDPVTVSSQPLVFIPEVKLHHLDYLGYHTNSAQYRK